MTAEAKKGIPDDTPENTLRAIRDILREVARELGASFKNGEVRETNHEGVELTVDIRLGEKQFGFWASCIKAEHLSGYVGTIGEGYISWLSPSGHDRLTLEMYHRCPPYRWSVYPGTVRVGQSKPTDRFLTGTNLRAVAREKLLS